MTMKVSGTYDVLLWLIGHTGTFEVVSPPELRDEVERRVKAARRRSRKRPRPAARASKK